MSSKHIVGRKTETYLTALRRGYGEPWVITKHTIVTELHATKGWRPVLKHKETQSRKALPTVKEWRLNDVTTFERTMPRKEPAPDRSGMYDQMRHPWQRKKAFWDRLRAMQEAA
jgi:hypothetical protein